MATTTRKEYLDRFKKIRQKRILKRAGGKDLIFDEERMIRAHVDREVPVMMQHCILKVYKKMRGGDKERYISAFNICAAVFQKNGYMKKKSFKMTGKGETNNDRHSTEKKASEKRGKYLRLTNRLWRVPMARLERERAEKEKRRIQRNRR